MNTTKLKNVLSLSIVATAIYAPSAFTSNIDSIDHSFPEAELSQWEERSFKGNSEYKLVELDGQNVLQATTQSAASVLYKRKIIDLTKTPILSWSWKIDNVYGEINEQDKSGDDFPARLYVVAQTGLLPWETVAINYVWSSSEPLGSDWSNPFTDKNHMVAVQSGPEFVGDWTIQKRDVAADFRQYFDLDIEELAGYAVMIDGDNSEQSGSAYFGMLHFSQN
jgi:hypothetical protein